MVYTLDLLVKRLPKAHLQKLCEVMEVVKFIKFKHAYLILLLHLKILFNISREYWRIIN